MSDKVKIDSEIPWDHLSEGDAGVVAKMKGIAAVIIATLSSLVAIGLAIATFYLGQANKESVADLQKQQTALSVELGKTQEERRLLQVEVKRLEEDLETYHDEVNELQRQLLVKEETIAALRDRIEELEKG